MNYTQALDYIHGAKKFPKNGLKRFESFLGLIGNPHKKLKFIHVAGTNGKGSTCAMLSSVLSKAGYKTGLYISPFIVRFNERISINQVNIPDDTLARICEYIVPYNTENTKLGFEELSEFEINTAIAFLYFLQEKCDIVVLETGMGGRLDATNVQDPLLSVITLIDYDHMAVLGNTIEKIAYEKSGIIKPGVPTILYPLQSQGALDTVTAVASSNNSKLFSPDLSELCDLHSDSLGSYFTFEGERYHISLPGKHQIYNALTVLETLKHLTGFNVTLQNIKDGLSHVKFPARMEMLNQSPPVFFDGAHNVSGAKMLYDNISEIFSQHELILVLGVLQEKGVDMFEALIKRASYVINVTPDTYRSMSARDALQQTAKFNKNATAFDSVSSALEYAEKLAKSLDNPLIISTGSLYLACDVKNYYTRKM